MQYLLAFLIPFLQSSATWISLATWGLKLLNGWLKLGMNDQLLSDMATLVSTWAVTHVGHGMVLKKLAAQNNVVLPPDPTSK